MEQQNDKGEVISNSLSLNNNFGSGHRHKFIVQGNSIICSCGKKKLNLKAVQDGMYEGIKSDGSKYSVRSDRRRYFFPKEWTSFIEQFKNDKDRLFFNTLLHTGARTMEALHLKPANFNAERGIVTFEVIKQRKAKRNFFATGKSRTFFVSPKYIKEVRAYINRNSIADSQYLFLDNQILPKDYEQLGNLDKKKYYTKTQIAYSQMFKRKVKSSGIKDWNQFSLHNIRKSYGNWMRTYDIKIEEICYRLGHDINTYLAHYGSAMIFTQQDKIDIMKIMGDVK